ncbi:hypothetical protein DYU05_07510 [Mucilaginibacter terrenus]|uniref:Uncharacterized protein n=1 Tax=Mucilaginibacter terrenus TaxID=2482727 RepID=A0A3E2NWP4_9SPHI|nr:hypothetical protein [Mucilaginibacter terrenus]RFZ85434.1 hypothetical protein DYU05_07510 [Mucilaginibacter terrenus]
MKKTIIAAALVLTTGIVSAFTIVPAHRDTINKKTTSTRKDVGTADTRKDVGTADTRKDVGTAD